MSSWLAYYVNKFAGSFFEDELTPEQLANSALLSGRIEFSDVRLKPRILEDWVGVILPVRMRFLHFEKIEI